MFGSKPPIRPLKSAPRSVETGGLKYDSSQACIDQQVIKHSFSANGVGVSDSFCHELYAYYASSEAYSLFPDVKPCLQRLHRPNHILGIISEFDERLEGIINGLGIGEFFEFTVQSYEFYANKPSDALYIQGVLKAQTITEKQGALPFTELGMEVYGWHIGDDPQKDAFQMAIPIILDRETTLETSFRKIRTLKDLVPELLVSRPRVLTKE
jgi:Haloacid dehalogenase-like hydrolase